MTDVTTQTEGSTRTQKSQLERAYEALRAALVACEIQPESKIRISEMCEEYGFSTGSVREALSRLTSDGFVIAEPQKGFRAAPISIQDLQELTESRVHIENLCLQMAIEKGDIDWESRVLAAHHRLQGIPMRLGVAEDSLNPDWATQHEEFHEALAAGCRNNWMLRLRQMLYHQSERYRQMSVPLDEADRDVAAEHQKICNAVLDRDSKRAAELMQHHLEATRDIVIQGLWPQST